MNHQPWYTHEEHVKVVSFIKTFYGIAGLIIGITAGILIRGLW